MIEINNKKLCESCFYEINSAEACPCCGYNKSEFTPDPMVLPLGTKLNDKIIIGRVMGKGGFGITYLGYDLRMDKIIAVKEYYPNGISYRAPGGTEVSVADAKSAETFESGAEKFYSEAQMVSQFNGNPNIVSVYDYFRANSTVYLIMEFLSGITLKNYVKKHGRLTDGQALYVMDKIVAALSITHSAGVLHRDISPDNIMICSDGKIKLIDFSAARQILTESSSNLTVVMKPGYTPIEQYTKKGRQGAWTDIYSLGVSIYYALTKIIIDDPYARMDSDEEFEENKHKINDSLWVILKKCTMINASDRYGSAIDLRKALKSVSAPLTAETIELSAEDLKDEPDEKEEAAARATAAPPDDVPATVMGSAYDFPEEIEIFESGAPEESAGSAPDTFDTPAAAPVTEKQARPSNKVKLTAAICSAAVLVIVIMIGVFIGINRQKAPDITSEPNSPTSDSSSFDDPFDEPDNSGVPDNVVTYDATYPKMKDGKLFFEMSGYYSSNGLSKQISKENFLRFDGDVKVTLELEHIPSSEWKGDSIRIIDSGEKWVEGMALNHGIFVFEDEDEVYTIFPEQKEFSFVVSRRNIDNMFGGMMFGVWNMYLKSAVLEAYDPAELEPGEDAVLVNINSRESYSLSNFIPLETLKAFDSDVKITLDIEYEKAENDFDNGNAYIFACNSGGQELVIEAENTSHVVWATDHHYFYYLGARCVPDKFIFTLPKSEIEKLDANGLCFEYCNLYIKSAAVEGVKTVVEIDSEYPGSLMQSNGIPQSLLEEFDGDVKITLDLERYYDRFVETGIYNMMIGVEDNTKSPVIVSAYNITVCDKQMYQLDGDLEKFVFVITKENIASLGGGELRFKVLNTIVRSATIEKYSAAELEPGSGAETITLNDSYPGDWYGSEIILKSMLEAVGGDVRLTLCIEEAAAFRSPSDGGDLKLWFNPVAVNEDWTWDQISSLTIGDNLGRTTDTNAFYLGMREQNTPVPEVITFVLPQSEISKMGQGLAFQTACLYVKSAALEKA